MSEFEKRNGRDRYKTTVFGFGVSALRLIRCAKYLETLTEQDANYVLSGRTEYLRTALCDRGYDEESKL